MARSSEGSLHRATVDGFGLEWTEYDQSERDPDSIERSFERYFASFPWGDLPDDAVGLDAGCGSGRWAAIVAQRGYHVVALDASPDALAVAAANVPSASFLNGSAVELPIRDKSLNFAFSIGVLHHLPDTEGALRELRRVLRPGAPFLVYLYYAFDNRPMWFRQLWRASDRLRRGIAAMSPQRRLAVTRIIAALVYWPLARTAALAERWGWDVERIPLSGYRAQPFYVMKTDALDRFGTQLEKRYTRSDIAEMLRDAGFSSCEFNPDWPNWCAVARA